jgi:Family of unknown function (DUF6448)
VPPHCESLDGPVVTAAREALGRGDVQRVLPYVSEQSEPELRRAFDLAVKARSLGPDAAVVADRWLFETAVRLHRTGEGAAFTGLKAAGLDVGPVIPAAERALESGSADRLAEVLCGIVRDQVARRHAQGMEARERAGEGLSASREYVEAALGLQMWAHGVYRQATTDPHLRAAAREGGDDGR